MATGIPQAKRKQASSDSSSAPTVKGDGIVLAHSSWATTRDCPYHPTNESGIRSNRLIYGDNLPVLSSLLQDDAVKGRVTLVYIDPPYATNSVFKSRDQRDAYADVLGGFRYLEFLRERLERIPV